MYIKINEVIREHTGIMFNGVSGNNVDKDYNSLANSLDFESCNIASFSELITTNKYRTTKYHTVLEDEECVVLTKENGGQQNLAGLVFRASSIKKYLMKTIVGGKAILLQEYISTVIPYSLSDASGSLYINGISSFHFDPSSVVFKDAGSSNNLATYAGADGTTSQYDWYDDTTCSEDYVMFPLYIDTDFYIGATAEAVYDIGYLTFDTANLHGIYNVGDVIKINEF